MPTIQATFQEMRELTSRLIKIGLIDRYRFPVRRNIGRNVNEITIEGGMPGGLGYGPFPYKKIYESVEQSGAYNYHFLDGGLVSMQYEFVNNQLVKHRLAFWANPDLEAFQNEPELYSEEEIYADCIDPSIVAFPFRFDFGADAVATANEPVLHPRSHISMGMYKGCRIPVCSPMPPSLFVGFVLRNFYNTAYRNYSEELGIAPNYFDRSLYREEYAIPHFVIRENHR